jgi:hypothetical protein
MIDAIFARSEGNPPFVEELLASTSRGAGLPTSLREAQTLTGPGRFPLLMVTDICRIRP